jgi:hypothetical protein
MEVPTDGQGAGADEGGGTDATGGIVHPEPVPGASDRREAALERRADRRELREQRRADRPDPRPVGDDDGDDGGGDDDDGDDDY